MVNFVADMDRVQTKARARFAFSEFLGSNGKRCTPERLLVLDMAMEQRRPFTGEELLRCCMDSPGLNVCRATLFNTLPLLIEAGFLRRLSHDGRVCYETVKPGSIVKPKQYMICTHCGKVHHSDAPTLAAWVESRTLRGFAACPESAVVYIYGLCSRCRRSKSAQKKNQFTNNQPESNKR